MLIKGTTTENRYLIKWTQPDYQGKGTYIWPNGSRYQGEFSNGRIEGTGAFYWPDGSSFRGEWHEDLPQGKGIFTWPDGKQYEIESDAETLFWRMTCVWRTKLQTGKLSLNLVSD